MNFLKNNFYVILAALTGAVIFILIYGINVLNPCFTGWIFTNEAIDLPQHYIGWEFFRNTDWQFPLGVFNTLSYPVNTSIINMDAIPIFAVFFKMFSGILPETFQYLGFFGLICYILQCAHGTVISKKFTK